MGIRRIYVVLLQPFLETSLPSLVNFSLRNTIPGNKKGREIRDLESQASLNQRNSTISVLKPHRLREYVKCYRYLLGSTEA